MAIGNFSLEALTTATSINLSWDKPHGQPPGAYDILRDGSKIGTTRDSSRTYTDTAIVAGAIYTYQVRSMPRGLLSETVEVRTEVVAKPLTAPVLTGTSGAAQVSLSWTAVAEATGYSWQRATGEGAFGASTDTSSLSAIDGTASSGTTYRYRVRATTTADSGPWSNIISVTPTASIPVAPTLTGTPGDGLNELDWNSVANAATYRLRRASGGQPATLLVETAETDYIDDTAVNDTTYTYTVRGVSSDGVLGSLSLPLDLTPVAASPAETPSVIGYAAVAGVTGGDGGTVHNVSTWSAFRAALEASGPRIINITGSANLDANGAEFELRDSDGQGNLTIDGSAWTGVMKDYKISFRCSNVIVREVAWRTGEGDTTALSADRRAITFIPETGRTIRRVLLDHCSFAWGPDVIASFLNDTADVTAQYCLFGPGLRESNVDDHPSGYGPNITDTAGGTGWPKRITYYRNAIIMCHQRTIRSMGGDGFDAVNNAIYEYGGKGGAAYGNPRGMNVVGNIWKKGPNTLAAAAPGFYSSLAGGNATSYFQNSVYFSISGSDRNLGLASNGDSTPMVVDVAAGVRRSTPYDGGPQNLTHGGLVVAAASEALFEEIIGAAGRTHQDDIDTLIKSHAIAGTSDGWYNGAGFPAPHPSY